MLKGRMKTQDKGSGVENDNEGQGQFKENPKVNEKIDAYIQNNPKHWDYIQKMPRERLERAFVLSAVGQIDRRQRMAAGIMNKLDQNPELKSAYETLVKHLPEEKWEKTMISIVNRTMRSLVPREGRFNATSV